jgi:hypothetical protein
MKINEFKKLEKKINDQNFNQGYKTINMVMTALSYFGHIASIFLAYFMLSKVLEGAMTDNKVAVFIASVVILGGLELLKRDIFDKFSIQYLKLRNFGKDVMPLLLLSITIIGLSFYASINGAAEYSSKSDKIESSTKDSLNTFKEETTKAFELKINSKELEIVKNKKVLDELSTLALTQTKLTKDQRKIQTTMPSMIDTLKAEKERLVLERDNTIKIKEEELTKDSKGEKDKNDKNSFAFVIISTLIEIVILAGVYFGEYYKFRSYKEFRDKIEKDPNYQKWLLYNEILEIMYTEDTKMNQKLPSNKSIIEMCKVNEIIVMPKDMINFLKTAGSLGIIKVSGSTRYINKQRDLAFETLRKNFNIE